MAERKDEERWKYRAPANQGISRGAAEGAQVAGGPAGLQINRVGGAVNYSSANQPSGVPIRTFATPEPAPAMRANVNNIFTPNPLTAAGGGGGWGDPLSTPFRGSANTTPISPVAQSMRPALDQMQKRGDLNIDLQRFVARGRPENAGTINIGTEDVNRLAQGGNYDIVAEAGKPWMVKMSDPNAFSNRIQSFIDQQNAITAEARARDEANRPPAIVGDTPEQTKQIQLDQMIQKASGMARAQSMNSGPGSWEAGKPLRDLNKQIATKQSQMAESAKTAAEIARERISSEGLVMAEDIKSQGALAKQAMSDKSAFDKAAMEKDADRGTERFKQQGGLLKAMLDQGNISLPELVPDWDNMNAFERRSSLTGLLKNLFADDSAPDPDDLFQ